MEDLLQKKCVEILCNFDEMYEDALCNDFTQEFCQYVDETVRCKGIIIIGIRGFMRSSKSTAGFFVSHLIRFYQQKYSEKKLEPLTPRSLIIFNTDIIDVLRSGEFDRIYQSDETVVSTGVGSKIEEDTIKNILEVCARARNHLIFINPNEFPYPTICKYGLMFFDRDDETKISRFLIYDMSNNYHKDMCIPLGLVTIPKLCDNEWKKQNWNIQIEVDGDKCYKGQKFDSEFEFQYETDVKLEIIKNQMSLESSKKRSQRLFKYVEVLKKDAEFIKALKSIKGNMDARRFIRGYTAKMLGGEFNSEEIQQLSDYVEGMRETLFNEV